MTASGNASPSPSLPVAVVTAEPTPAAFTPPPTATLAPTSEPSATAEPTSVPTAAPTPRPTATPKSTPKPTPVPPILSKTGRGDKVLKFRAQDGPTVARITNRGGSNFAVIAYVGSQYDDLLVNVIGSYAGRVYVAPGVSLLKITSNGSWKVDVRPIDSAPHWNGAKALAGKGDLVVILSGGGFGTTRIRNKGRDHFAVIAYGTEGDVPGPPRQRDRLLQRRSAPADG